MRYMDPLNVTCTDCGRNVMVSVRLLLQLTAQCPRCSASLRQIGVKMTEAYDKCATHYDAVRILLQIEDEQGIRIPDSAIEQITAWEKITVGHLISAAHSCLGKDRFTESEATAAVRSAIIAEFPSAPTEFSTDDRSLMRLLRIETIRLRIPNRHAGRITKPCTGTADPGRFEIHIAGCRPVMAGVMWQSRPLPAAESNGQTRVLRSTLSRC